MASNMQPYFHYTSKKHLDAIMACGYIKESDPKVSDAISGKGVYLTRQGPTNKNKKDIAENNWDAGWEQALRDKKLDYFICVLLPAKEVTKVPMPKGDTRDIYIYKGDLHYKNYQYEIMKWPTKEHVAGVDLGLVVFGLVVGVAALVGNVLNKIFT